MGSFDWDQVLPEPDVLGRCFHELFKANPDQQRKRSEWKEGSNKRKFSKAKEKRRMKVDILPVPPPSLFPQQMVFGSGAGPGGVGLLFSQSHQYYLGSIQSVSPPDVTLPGNASFFAAFATVRMALLDRRNKLAMQAYLASSSSALALSGSQPAISPTTAQGVSPARGIRESDAEDETDINREAAFRVPKIVGIGLRSVFELIRESRALHPRLCTKALGALLDVIQGQAPEGLKGEPSEVMDPLFELLLDLATSHGPESAAVDDGSHPTAVACACLLALVVATGATPRLLSATAALLTSPRALSSQHIHMPQVLASLQRSVQEVLLHLPPISSSHQPPYTTFSKTTIGYGVAGPRPDWMTHGVQKAARIDSFRISIPSSIADSTSRGRRGLQLPVDPPPAIASDGQFIYIFLPCTNRGASTGVLLKVGSGYGATVRGHTYLERPGPHPDASAGAWLGFASGHLYFKPLGSTGKKGGNGEVLVLDRETLRVTGVAHIGDQIVPANGVVSLPSTSAAPPPPTHSVLPCVIFSDGENLGTVTAAKDDGFIVRILNPAISPMSVVSELPLRLARKCLEVVGTAPLFGGSFSVVGPGEAEDEAGACLVGGVHPSNGPSSQGASASGSPLMARTIQTGWEEEVASIAAGKDFAVIRTISGKVLYCGKASSLGIKQPQQPSGLGLGAGAPSSAAPLGAPRIILSGSAASSGSVPTPSFLSHKWSELPIVGLSSGPLLGPASAGRAAGVRIAQIAIGHEGQHVVLLTEEGIPLFAGTARRGEDGDQIKARRQPKATKPKRMVKAEGHEIIWAACNNGTTALVSADGLLMLFGKDTAHCDHTTGVVSDLRGIRIVQVALGKAHAVALTAQGHIYTFGINNKGQCGRDYCPSSIPSAPLASHQPKEVIAMETAAEGDVGANSFGGQGEEEEDEGGAPGDWEASQHQMGGQRGEAGGAGIMCPPGRHKWKLDQCMVCTVCRECTGYSISCLSSIQPDRNPGQECGCGEGDSGCSVCGCCRICARENVDNSELAILGPCGAGDMTGMVRLDLIFGGQHGSRLQENLQRRLEERKQRQKSSGVSGSKPVPETATSGGGVLAISTRENALLGMGVGENEQDGSGRGAVSGIGVAAGGSRVASLPPARVNIPDDSPVMHIACGLHHTVLLLASGAVYTFGSNSHGQLGVGDLAPRGGPNLVRLPPHPPSVSGVSSQECSSRIAIQIAAGSNHTVILTADGEVFTFGSYQKGQLGRAPTSKGAEPSTSKSVSIHLLATELAPPCGMPSSDSQPSHPWNSVPGTIPGIGPRHGRRASWIGASAEHTFIRIEESLINAASLSRSTLLANGNCILLLPTGGWDSNGEENRSTTAATQGPFHCLTIARREGSCTIFSGRDQVNFTGTAACLDPVYNVIWSLCNRQLVCYNAVAAVARGSLLPYVSSPRDKFCDIPSILTSELALPVTPSLFCPVRRSQAALHLLGCLDTLTQAHEAQWWWWRKKGLVPWRLPYSCTSSPSPAAVSGMQRGQMDPMMARRADMMVFMEDGLGRGPMVEGEVGVEEGEEEDVEGGRGGGKVYSQEDFSAVNRFESNGGGWGYAGQSVEAIRFSADTDILLGGFGLFGGRGDYIGKIKLFDIGMEGGEREGKGELLAETDDLPYECGPRQKYPMLFDEPIPLQANRWYVAWARVTGPSSDCGSNGQAMVTTEDQVTFYFKSSKKSNNGTDVNAGQIPQILYRVVAPESEAASRQIHSSDEPVHILSREFSRTVSKECFQSLISLLQWSWNTFKAGVTEATMPPHFRSHQRSASHPPTPCTPFLLQSSSSSSSTTPSNSSSPSSTSPSPPGQPPRLTSLVDLHRLVYISRSSLRLLRTYTNEIYPNDVLWRCLSPESAKLAESVGDVRALLRQILLDPLPPPLGSPSNFHSTTTKRTSHSKSKTPLQKGSSFPSEEAAQETGQEMPSNLSSLAPYWQMTSSILDECHRTFVACFHAFYPTPALKWTILCHLLSSASAADNKDGGGSPSSDRLLSAVLAALCSPSIRLRSTLPLLGNLGIGKGATQESSTTGRRSPSPAPPPAAHSPSCCSSSVSSSDASESDASDSPTSSRSSSSSPTSFASSTVSSSSASSSASVSSSSSSPDRARRKKHRHCKDRKRRAAVRAPAITIAPSTPPNNTTTTSEAHYYPMLVEHMNYRSRVELGGVESVGGYWSFRDVLEHLLMLICSPVEKALSKYTNRSSDELEESKMEANGQQQLVYHCCNLLSRVVAELASQSSGSDEQVHGGCGGRGVLHATPCRFAHSIQGRSWNTGNGSPDALCFSVDRPGIAIAGVGLYGGTGQNEYELEILVDESGMGGPQVSNAARGEPLPLLLQHQSPQQQHILNHAPHNQQQLRQMAIAVIAGQDQQLMQHHLMDHQAPHTQRWTALEVVRGSYGPHDLVGDIFEVKFDKAVPIKENVKYVIRLRNHGGKTSNGDGGLSSVRGPDGATFTFSSSSLSFNGTTQTRGQIPHLLYYSNPQDNESQQASRAMAELEARRCTLWITSAVVQRCIRLAVMARRCTVEEEEVDEEVSVEEKGKKGKSEGKHKAKQRGSEEKHTSPVEVLSSASIVSTLLPLVLAHVGPVAVSDPKSSVQVLGLIRDLLPHIAALNNSTSVQGGAAGSSSMQHSVGSLEASHAYSTSNPATVTTSNHYAWVESEHPYKPATVSNYRVSFPESVKWLCIEFDSRCGTAQAEDSLQLYIPSSLPSTVRGAPSYNRQHSRSTYDGITGDDEFTELLGDDEENMDDADDDMEGVDNRNFHLYGAAAACVPSSDPIPVPFWPVLRKFSGSGANGNWPTTAVLLPGNEVIFSLETASDYVKDERGCTFGFRCLVVGYEWSGDKDGLKHLESELAYLGGMCAASLMRKDLALPVSASVEDEVEDDGDENFSTVMKKGISEEADGRSLDLEAIEEQAQRVFAEHSSLLGMGFALSNPPTIVQALDGTLPFSCHSNERLFLSDFVHCTSGTSGGRLSWWLQPESYVDPRRCEALLTSSEGNTTLRCGWPTSVTLLTRDQYGDVVHAPNLLVEVKAVPIEKKDAVEGTSSREGASTGEKQTNMPGVCLGGESRDADSGGSRPRKLRRLGKHRHHHHHHHHHKHQQRHKGHTHHQQQKSAAGSDLPDASAFGGHPRPHLSAPYEVTVKDKMCYHAVTIMKEYEQYSFEELRYASPSAKRCAECLLVRSNGDGTYSASWTPSCAGWYSLHMTVDGYPVEQTYKVEVREPPQGLVPPSCSGISKRMQMQQQVHHSHHGHHHHHHHGHHSSVICPTSAADPTTSTAGGGNGIPAVSSASSTSPSSRLRRFVAKNSAGLRIRAHPSLQSEQIGVVHVNGTVAFVEEIHNDDGVWLRLSPDTVRQYCGGDEVNYLTSRSTPGASSGGGGGVGNAPGAVIGSSGGVGGAVVSEAWCLQYNQHLGRTLLVPTEEPKSLLDEVLRTTILRNIPQRKEGSREHRRMRGQGTALPTAGGPGTYQVVKCGASGHNVRSRPSLKAPPVGMLELGNQLSVAQDLVNSEGTWVRLDGESMQKFCFNTGGEAWSLARSRSDVQYLQGEDEEEDEEVAVEVLPRGVSPMVQPHSVDREFIHDARPQLSSGDLASSSPYPSPKRAFDFSSGISSSSSPRHRTRQRHVSSGASSSSSIATAAPPPFNFGGTAGQSTSSAINGVTSTVNPFVFGSNPPEPKTGGAVDVPPAMEKVEGVQKVPSSQPKEGIGTPGTPVLTTAGGTSKGAPEKEKESSKFAALQKWLKGEESRTSSERRGSPGRDLPPELVGVSVKELVKAIGESRANGNGITPPGTPPRRTSRSSSPKGIGHSPSPHLNSRSSSPGVCSVAGTGGVGSGVGAGTTGIGGGSQRRGSAHSDTTSALVSSLTRDLSQSPSGSSSVLTRSADSPNGILPPPPPSITSQPIGINASSSMHRDISGEDKDPAVESSKTTTQTGTQTSPESSRAHFSIGSGGIIGASADQSLPLRLSPKLSRSSKQLRSKRAMSPASAGCSSRYTNGVGSKDKLNPVKDTFKEVPPMPSPVKEAMSPSVAECLRAAFAALLWHEGVVHDAMACASFLKFHPGLPKNGAVVVARDGTGTIDLSGMPGASMEAFVSGMGQGEALTKEQKARQRHSVEVSMGTYLHIQPSSPWMPELIGQGQGTGEVLGTNTTPSDPQQQQFKTVTVLPPALKALVTLWEEVSIGCLAALSRQGPMAQIGSKAASVAGPFAANQAVRRRTGIVQGGTIPSSPHHHHHHHHHKEKKGQRKKKEWKTLGRSSGNQGEEGESVLPYWEHGIMRRMRSTHQMGSAWCELCGGLFPHPVTHHMRAAHPGCGAHSGKGYNSIGQLVSEYVGSCGDGGVGDHLWYLMCEACWEKYISMRRKSSGTMHSVRTTPGRKSPSIVKVARKKASNATSTTPRENLFATTKASLPSPIRGTSSFQQGNVHHFMRANAAFLLDLASAAGTGLPPAREMSNITPRISAVPGMGSHHKRRRRHGESMPLSGPIPPPPSSSSSSSATSMPVVSEHGPPPSNRVPTAPSTSQFAFFELPPASSSSSNSSTPSSSVSSAAEPPFQCLKALGVNPSQLRAICEERLLEETLRRNGERGLKRLLEGNILPSEGGVAGMAGSGKSLSKGVACDGPLSDNESEGSKGRTFHRSISMGTTARESWNRRGPASTNLSEGGPSASQGGKGTMGGSAIETNVPGSRVVMRRRNNSSSGDAHDTGSSLLCYASPALQKLVMPLDRSSKSANEDTAAGTAAGSSDLLSHPVLMFLLQQHDLHGLQIAMRQALRRATCRVYAMQALNWLLRNVTQPVCLHDLLWWFVVALSPSGSTISSTVVDHNLPEGAAGAHRDDNRPERKDDFLEQSRGVCDHPLSDVSVGGEAVDPLQESFHSLLQTVADLMLLLPMGSPLQTMAIRCWGIRFRTTDHAFLHRSHVFSNISKILSRSEEDQEEGITSSMHESHTSTHSFSQPVSSCVVEALKDLTSSVEMKASSRQAMVGSLCDNSTETFWESGDEDRNKTKTITILCQPHIFPRTVYVHIDNCRDLANKVSSVTFQSGINLDELYRLRQVEVESRSTGWVSCPIIDPSHRVIRLEVKGPDNSLRLRQVRVLGELEGESLRVGGHTGGGRQRTSMTIQQRCCETETLRVFRLITSQVFGKLILGDAGEHGGGKLGKNEIEDVSAEDRGREGDGVLRKSKVASSGAVEDDSKDLKEHMVGILFSRSKLTHLQRQVCAHIVQAIRKETIRVREEWEALLCSGPQTPSGAGPQGQWMSLNSAAQQNNDANKGGSSVPPTDTYCFEMLSMVLALSGSSVGRAYLSHQYGLLSDLLSLLHTGSARVQRQVTSLLRRMLPEVSPAALASILSIDRLPPADFGIVPHHPSIAVTKRNPSFHTSAESAEPAFDMNRVGILDVFLSCIAKALTVQVKVKGKDASIAAGLGSSGAAAGIGPPGGKGVTTVTLATCIHPRGERASGGRWWLRGCMNRKLAEVIIQLLKDMAQGKLSDAWAQVTKSAVAEGILNLTRLGESVRTSPNDCLRTPTLWLALASLCVLDQDHAQRLSSGRWGGTANQDMSAIGPHGGPALPPRPTCTNHDDGETTAIIQCNSCGNLCADCDRFLHLHRKTRMHQRQVCKEEEEAIKVDLHEGCGRTKLFWILALADSRTLKAMVEFRRDGAGSSGLGGSNGNGSGSSTSGFGSLAAGSSRSIAMGLLGAGITGPTRIGTAVASGVCRFCGTTGNSGLLAIGNVCADHECQEHARNACSKLHPCGHLCGGIAGESPCLPCLHGCIPTQTSARSPTSPSSLYAPSKPQTNATPPPPLKQDADDMCMICFTEALSCAPAIQLKCGHVFHLHCCRNVLMKKWAGPRITFSFAQCPICKADIHHTVLEDLLTPVRALMEDVRRKALMRLEYEGLHGVDAISAPHGRFHKDPAAFAMDRYAYYVCYKCKKAYYGGEARCDLEAGGGDGGEEYDPAELVCGGCSDVSRAQMCPKHGTDFLEYKCRYCCSVAVFFCFGTTHFCNACHDDFQRVTNIPRHELPHCPAGPKAKQLDGEECPLHVAHPPTGEEFALGCGVCRNAHTF